MPRLGHSKTRIGFDRGSSLRRPLLRRCASLAFRVLVTGVLILACMSGVLALAEPALLALIVPGMARPSQGVAGKPTGPSGECAPESDDAMQDRIPTEADAGVGPGTDVRGGFSQTLGIDLAGGVRIQHAAVNADGNAAIVHGHGSDGEPAIQWWIQRDDESQKPELVRIPLASPATPVTAVAISEDGGRVAVGFASGQIRLFWPDLPGKSMSAAAHGGPVAALAFTSDGSLVLSGGEDGFLRSFSAQTLTDPRSAAVGEPVSQIAVAGASGFALVLGEDGGVVSVALTSFRRSGLPWPHGRCTAVAVAADGLRYAAVTRGGRLVVGSMGADAPFLDRDIGLGVLAVSLSPECRSVVLGRSGVVQTLSVPSRRGVESVVGRAMPLSMEFAVEGQRLVAQRYSRSGRPLVMSQDGVWIGE